MFIDIQWRKQVLKAFRTGRRWRKSSLKTKFQQKLKLFAHILGKPVDSGRKSGGGGIVFTFYSLCQSLWGSRPAVNSISKSIDSQGDSSEALESAASHFSSTVTDKIGLLDDHKKSQENADSNDHAADDEEVNGNPVGQSQQYPVREKVKIFLKIVEVKNSLHAWVPSPKYLSLLKNT